MSLVQSWFLVVLVGVVIAALYFFVKRLRYQRAVNREFPVEWRAILKLRLPVYSRLSESLQRELETLVLHFLYTKKFIGCAGLDVTDEVRVVIAAEASILLLNRPSRRYAGLRWIYVYPTTFIAKRARSDAYGVVSNQPAHLLGESWGNGKVVLAWDSVESGLANYCDGQNVVLHEFAHQLDQEDGVGDGAPLLYTRDSYRIWSQVFSHEFTRLQMDVARGRHSLIDRYGATNPAEFFAVVTEVFFERPMRMSDEHPELFEQLMSYYRLDPREFHLESE